MSLSYDPLIWPDHVKLAAKKEDLIMSTYVALVQHTDKGDCNSKRAVTDIKDATAVAERLGIKVRNLYWSGAYNAVLVLQAADKHGITTWQDSLQNLRVELIPTAPSSDPATPLTFGGWRSSSDMVQWWY